MYFSLGQVLSITTHILLCEVEDLYEIMNFMLNAQLYTHQLPDAADICGPALLEQFPQLNGIVVPENLQTKDQIMNWLMLAELVYGKELDVQPIR